MSSARATSTNGKRDRPRPISKPRSMSWRRIWDAVIPFHPLLARDLTDQTEIAHSLAPPSAADSKSGASTPSGKDEPDREQAKSASKDLIASRRSCFSRDRTRRSGPAHGSSRTNAPPDATAQTQGRGRAARLEKPGSAEPSQKGQGPSSGAKDPRTGKATGPDPVDPKQIKAGLSEGRRPGATRGRTDGTSRQDTQAQRCSSGLSPAEEARKILEEIQKAQPRKISRIKSRTKSSKNRSRKTRISRRNRISRTNRSKISGKMTHRRTISRSGIKKRRSRKSPRNPTSRNRIRSQRNSHRSHAIGSKKRCARSANESRKSANATAR